MFVEVPPARSLFLHDFIDTGHGLRCVIVVNQIHVRRPPDFHS